MRIYVGNLDYKVNDSRLRGLFEGENCHVKSASVVIDRDDGRSKGFGFVEIEDEKSAEKAIKSLNGTEFDGRKLVVNEARPKKG